MRKFLTSIALAALVAGTAHADPGGNGKGGGKGQGGGGSAQAGPQMNGGGHAGHGNGGGNGGQKAQAPAQMQRMAAPAQRSNGNGNAKAEKARSDSGPSVMRVKENGNGNGNGNVRAEKAMRDSNPGNDVRVVSGDRKGNAATLAVPGRVTQIDRVAWRDYDSRALVDGCPPGLAKKNNGCTPPGLAKQQTGWDRYDADWWGLRGLNNLSGYRYYDGNLVRLSPAGAISGYYPLLGGALALGNIWPSGWTPTPVPQYYVDYYGLGDDYRYFDGAMYRLDPQTQAIESIAALLTGDTFNIGQRIPDGYGVYNVPYDYRDRYVDGPDAYYRYNDGYVYQVDPTTQLIVAAINLLT